VIKPQGGLKLRCHQSGAHKTSASKTGRCGVALSLL